jgi:hypothetical protein
MILLNSSRTVLYPDNVYLTHDFDHKKAGTGGWLAQIDPTN